MLTAIESILFLVLNFALMVTVVSLSTRRLRRKFTIRRRLEG